MKHNVDSELVRRALSEDVGSGDITTSAIVPEQLQAQAVVLARSSCVVAGLDIAAAVFRLLDARVRMEVLAPDGTLCQPDQEIAVFTGSARALLTGERTALNFLQRLSGIATITRSYVEAAGSRVTILDTRKTTPGLRALEKYAVRCGGGTNHRFGLFDAILIKDNHIRVAGSVAEAVRRVRASSDQMPIEVEAQSLPEVHEAIEAGADTIMLDNLSVDDIRTAIDRIAGRARVEISGGVSLETLPALADLGADVISVGALTHSARAADISLEIETGVESSR
jgi:nicotinate-nucleotide pyrophosphorylase (carboxylating)